MIHQIIARRWVIKADKQINSEAEIKKETLDSIEPIHNSGPEGKTQQVSEEEKIQQIENSYKSKLNMIEMQLLKLQNHRHETTSKRALLVDD